MTALVASLSVVVAGGLARHALRRTRARRLRSRLVAAPVPAGGGWPLGRRRRSRRLVAELPDVLDAFGRHAASGLSAAESLRRAGADASGDLADDLAAVLGSIDRGSGTVPALEEWARRRPWPEIGLVASALGQAIASGGSLARAAHQVAEVLRANLDSRRVVVGQAAQARASATVVGSAPLVILAVSAVVDTATVEVLVTTPIGLAALGSAVVLDALAAWWMAGLIAAAERAGR